MSECKGGSKIRVGIPSGVNGLILSSRYIYRNKQGKIQASLVVYSKENEKPLFDNDVKEGESIRIAGKVLKIQDIIVNPSGPVEGTIATGKHNAWICVHIGAQ